MSRVSDRNLLFGILALQMDFITRDSLVDGMQAWLLNKQKSLGELLVERGTLAVDDHKLLEPLVDAHIRKHGGAEQSLAALSSDDGVGAKLKDLDDPDLQASLLAMPQPVREVGIRSSVLGEQGLETRDEIPVDPNDPRPESFVGQVSEHGQSPPDPIPNVETNFQATLAEPEQSQMRFRILRPHAEGGLGKVSVARDHELNREVAFKEIKVRYAQDRNARSRFVVEAEVTGGLEHPGIVPVYGLGHFADGRPFYAMRFIKGDSLQEASAAFHKSGSSSPYDQDLWFRNLIKRLIDVCNAIAYAHSRKVLHRDLKPGNIMLGKYGETLVVDWGLAKAQGVAEPTERSADGELPIVPSSGSQSAPTLAGAVLGTAAYMPPEQAAGHLEQLGPACDIYSLGATLYHLLTGQAPLKGVPIVDLLKRVIAGDIPSPKSLNPRVPAALNAVCQKAMSRAITDRYAAASDIGKDLEAWLADKPVSAFPEPLLVRVRRWSRQHPALVSSVTAAALMMTVGLLLGFVVVSGKNSELDHKNVALSLATKDATESATKAQASAIKAQQEELNARNAAAEAKRQEAAAKKSEHLANVRLYGSQIADAKRELESGNQGLARLRLDQTKPDFRGWEYSYLDRIHPCRLTLNGHSEPVMSVSFSPDGKRIVSGSHDKTLKVWDAQTGELVLTLNGHSKFVFCVSFSPDGKRIVSGSLDKTLKVWDAQTGESLLTLNGHSDWVRSVSFSPDGKRIVSDSMNGTLKVWNAQTGEPVLTLNGHEEGVTYVSFSPDGKRIVSGSLDATLMVWDVQTGEPVLTLNGHSGSVMSVSFSPDGKRIVSGSRDNTLKVWDAQTGEPVLTLKGHSNAVESVSFSPDGKRIVSGSGDATLKVWDAQTGEPLLTLNGHSGGVSSVSFSPDGKRIVSGSVDNTLKVWNAQTGGPVPTFNGHSEAAMSVSFSPDGKRIVSGSGDKTLKVWDAQTGETVLALNGHSDAVTSVSFSLDGKRIVSGSFDKTLKVWDVQTGETVLTLNGHSGHVMSVSFSSNGKRIVSGSNDNTLKVWDAETGEPVLTLNGHSEQVTSVSFSPDGKRIVSGSVDKTLKVWDAQTGEPVLTLNGHSESVTSVSFSPDGTRIVSGSDDKSLKVWDALTGELVLTLNGHSYFVTSVSFSPDGKRIVSGSWDKTLKVWDAQTGEPLLTLNGHSEGVSSVSFSPDGKRIVSSSEDETLKVWDAGSGSPVDQPTASTNSNSNGER
ncbi:MAG: protein kinase domain-containing protein [Planctomycetaceae bacterium]